MAFSKKLKSNPVIEVTVDQPSESSSTEIHINDTFTIDLEDLQYKKTRETTNDVASDRHSKCKETFYLEEIDDGPKRLTFRSDYKSTTSIDVLDIERKLDQDLDYQTEHAVGNKDKQSRMVQQDDVYEQSPAVSHIEKIKDGKKNKETGSSERTNRNRGTKAKSTSNDKRQRKTEGKVKHSTKKHNSENRTSESSILTRTEDVSEIRKSVYITNDAGNGIDIILPSYLLPDDYGFESIVWNADERGAFLKQYNFTHQQRFRTDIFHIYRKGPNEDAKGNHKPLSYPEIDPSNITVKVHIPELSHMNGLCLKFKAHVKFRKQWEIIDTIYEHNEGVVTFNSNQIESFCIISNPRNEQHIVPPDGYEFVSEADNRIKADFPMGAVSQNENIDFKVIPLNRESMATKIQINPRNCFILAISECLAVRHNVSSFHKPIDIQLPVEDLPGIDTSDVKCKYGVFKRKHKGSFWLTDLEVVEKNGIPTITVSNFSEYVILKVRLDMFDKLQALLPEEIEVAIGDKMCCKILFFVSNRKANSISVMLECATKDSMEDISQRRRHMGYELMRQCPSPDFFFPVNQRIRVDVGGRFALTKHIGKGYYFLTFFPIAVDNFICFPVDRYSGMGSAVYGIISFKEDNGTKKDLHAIHYDPWSSRGKPQIRPYTTGVRSAPVSRQTTAASGIPTERGITHFEETFFSDKGLLAVAQSLSPDAMFKVVINLDMTKAQYEQITNDYSALTTSSRHLQLIKTALEMSTTEPKIQRLTSALRDSDENSIAEKIEKLYFDKMNLSRTNLERKPTTVTIRDEEHT